MATGKEKNAKNPMSLLIVLMAGLFLAILNQTLLNVAMPHLMTEFGVSATTIQWLTTGYMLVNGVLIPLSAFLITRFGKAESLSRRDVLFYARYVSLRDRT